MTSNYLTEQRRKQHPWGTKLKIWTTGELMRICELVRARGEDNRRLVGGRRPWHHRWPATSSAPQAVPRVPLLTLVPVRVAAEFYMSVASGTGEALAQRHRRGGGNRTEKMRRGRACVQVLASVQGATGRRAVKTRVNLRIILFRIRIKNIRRPVVRSRTTSTGLAINVFVLCLYWSINSMTDKEKKTFWGHFSVVFRMRAI